MNQTNIIQTKPNQSKTLVTIPFPKMILEFARENFNLKMLSLALLSVTFLSLMLVLVVLRRGPTVIALDGTGQISTINTKITDLQIEAAAKQYFSYRYSWSPDTISSQLKKAEFFIAPSEASDFSRSMQATIKYVAEKDVTQRVYPRTMAVDFKNKSIAVIADRITEFDKLKAATVLHARLNFEIGDRTVTNPWGVYITSETESDTGSSQ